MNALAGKAAGVQINSSASGPGGGVKVVMRGAKSITQNNNALYVIDGIPMFNVSFGESEGQFATQAGSDGVADINPDDIESITVLKDATATSIYGANGANGVILITTKKGSKGQAKVNIDTNVSFSNLTRTDKLDMTDTDLFLEVLNEAIDNYNLQTNSTQARIDNPAPGKAQTNWLDLVPRLCQAEQIKRIITCPPITNTTKV